LEAVEVAEARCREVRCVATPSQTTKTDARARAEKNEEKVFFVLRFFFLLFWERSCKTLFLLADWKLGIDSSASNFATLRAADII